MNRNRTLAVLWSLLLHVVILGAGIFSFGASQPMAMPRQLAIEATVVDLSLIEEMRQAEQDAREEEARRQAEEVAGRERERREAEAERIRLEQEREAARLLEEQEQAARVARQKAEAEAQERLEREQAEQQLQAELKRKKEAEEKQRVEAERRHQEELARKRREEEKRRQEEAEALLLAQLQEEEQRLSAARAGLREQYALLIKQKIERSWLRPDSAGPGLECELSVTQLPSREVVDVRVGTCNADAATMRSIEAAVYKASPLPEPPDPTLFERRLKVIFKPDG